MCFMLYAGTNKPLPRREFNENAPDLSVKSLGEADVNIAGHFSRPEVQYIGSTSCCGCDFPHSTMYSEDVAGDPESDESEHFNREALATLLRESGEGVVELYGIWLSNSKEDPLLPERFRDEIPLATILDPAFRFKERGFYRVNCGQVSE